MNINRLAIRHLKSRPRQTMLIFLGVTFGSLAFVTISGFFEGFQGFLVDQLVNNDAHIKISAPEEVVTENSLDVAFFGKEMARVFWNASPSGRRTDPTIADYQNWYSILGRDPRVEAFSSHLTAQANVVQKGLVVPVSLIGVIPNQIERVTTLKEFVLEGSLDSLATGGGNLLAGQGVLDKLGARIGQTVFIEVPGRKATPFKIVGRFATGIRALDETRIYGYLPEVQLAAGRAGQINEIAVRLHNYSLANEVAGAWASFSDDKVLSWDEISANVLSVFEIQNVLRILVIGVITVVAGFGIYNVLNMVVNQKKKEIAILRSMGYRSSHVLHLFLVQGLIVGVAGGLTGVVLGFLACLYLETIPFSGGPVGNMGHLRISFAPSIYFSAMMLSMVSSTIAGFLPARAAGRMTPIEIIRSGTE